MARFVPDVSLDDILYPSERAVYAALRSLPDPYVVLHSFPWLRPSRDLAEEPLREGEADFLVLHPEKGMLVLEVKGGVPELRGRTWHRGGRDMRDPFDQARRSRYALLDAVEERTRRRIHRGLLTHGDAVVFPDSRYDGPLPINTDERIFINAGDLNDLVPKIDGAFAAWRRSESRLSPSQFVELLDALMPKLRLMRCAGAAIAAEGSRIVQITGDQRATLLGLLRNARVLVEGTAGSGKTMLALEFALTLAAQGEHVLFLCFNRPLRDWVQEQAASDHRWNSVVGRLEIATFHSFALRLAHLARVEFEVPAQGQQEFWDQEVPLILEQAVEVLASNGTPAVFDAVIVDEAQDFAPDWWVTVESLTRDGRRGRLYAFLDLHQSLRGDACLPPVPFATRFPLTTNCRNTRSIARSAAHIAAADVTVLPGAPEGEAPAVRRAASEAAEASVVIQEVRQLLRQGIDARQIALIGPASHERGALRRHDSVDGTALIDDAGDWRRGGGVLVTTARSFKGLEADVVIVYGLSGFGPAFTRSDLYVAWTRARHRLFVVCHGGEVRSAVEAALADASHLVDSAP